MCCRLEKWQPLPVKVRQPRGRRIYLFIKSLSQQLSTFPCFWPVICFFIHWTSNFNLSARIENSILWSLLRLHLKSRPHSEIKLPIPITNIYSSVPELEKSVLLDLALLHFTAVASQSFYCPSWWATANSSSATLSCTCFWIFLPSGMQSETGRQCLNRVLESLFTFTLLVFRTKQGAWHKRVHLRNNKITITIFI